MKRFRYLIILAVLSLFILPANAQSNWIAYFYNNATGNLSYVSQDGQSQDFSLGYSGSERIDGLDLAYAHTRTELAYCNRDSDGTSIPSQRNTSLVVRDIPNQQNLMEIDLGLSYDCKVGIYNDNDSILTVGLLRHFGNETIANPELPNWEILMIDANTGSILNSLNSNNPAAAIVVPYEGATSTEFFVPRVFRIDDAQLIFEAHPDLGQGLSYSYNLNSGEIRPYEHWGYSYSCYGNEEIWLTRLEDYPAATPTGPGETQNALMYVDSSGTEKIVYYTAEWEILRAIFINGGEQIAIKLFKAVTPEDPTQYRIDTVKWIVIDRQGNESELIANADFTEINSFHNLDVHAVFEGYGILETIHTRGTQQTTFRFSLVQNGTETLIWERMTATGGIYFVYMPEMPYQEFPAFPEFDLSSISTEQ